MNAVIATPLPYCTVARSDEGRMKGLAFAYDPDGYWIELVPRDKGATHPEQYNLGQTMLRVKDVKKTLDFYTGQGGLGMTKASECDKLVTTQLFMR